MDSYAIQLLKQLGPSVQVNSKLTKNNLCEVCPSTNCKNCLERNDFVRKAEAMLQERAQS